ncbi:MAG TPA: decaprenyl-phosphate phosphoribosyltransferase [Methanobacterium sp.]|nr:decaprenyl-phosphate phosphoribosyltransferase [Methanobacterium sp.]
MIKELIISMRPKQWYKNLVIFIGIVFSLNLLNFNLWINSISAFVIFCALSGSIYIINDILDIEKDKNHPKKRLRPIASGKLKINYAILAVTILVILSFGFSYLINLLFLIAALTFFILLFIYSLFLKQLIIVDIMVISTGFVLRAIAGCLAIGVLNISPWLIIGTFILAIFLAIGKRRHELVLLGDKAGSHRKILDGYSTEMLDQMMNITTSALIMSYSLYTFFIGKNAMMLTIPFAFYGIFRYIYLVHTENFGGEPEMLFKDKGMLLSMILWVLLVIIVLYNSSIFRILGVF